MITRKRGDIVKPDGVRCDVTTDNAKRPTEVDPKSVHAPLEINVLKRFPVAESIPKWLFCEQVKSHIG